ncbi:alkaline phosphatase [Sphingomonas jinjuensis]|uniref:Alkaline phosphatase n=1 Tax=Sphingomonas jinjuensis TaxID=535907 RepID=A0A840FFQ2_9SPHN|nr:alkaline phosphatase [Sphingomonas jinjuensis]MBB4154534.1 alkaline phosphatase [Sphingomonas jinjuensis]
MIARTLAAALVAATLMGHGAAAMPRGARHKAVAAKPAARPRNIILFLGDAGGIPTLNAGGLMAHDRPQALFIQSMPHIGLSDTSARNRWVTDSAAGMTAIMSGHKTDNGMVGMVPAAGDGGAPVAIRSFMEIARAHGLATGVVTNQPIWDATPAACFAHVPSRKDKDAIFAQMLAPQQGKVVDILVGRGLGDADAVFAKRGTTAAAAFAQAGYRFGSDPALIAQAPRAAVLLDTDYAPTPAVEATVRQLARNPKGYVLMVEWDMHTDDALKGLRHVAEMDAMIRRIRAVAGPDTLILFTADHSFGLRMTGGERGTPLAAQYAAAAAKPRVTSATNPVISVEDSHTGEEVLVAADGPGAEAVHGFFPNTRLFHVMMGALGWDGAN